MFKFFTPTKGKKAGEPEKGEFHGLSSLPDDFDPARCKVTPLPKSILNWAKQGREQFGIMVEGFLTPEECQTWIAESEQSGYEPALVNIGGGKQRMMTDVRNSSRCVIDDERIAAQLWQRIKPFLPDDCAAQFRVLPKELNERLRFLRYDSGEYFAPHCDGSYAHPGGHPKNGQTSVMTFFLYLNEGFEGGATRYYSSYKEDEYFDCIPKTGMVVVFEHHMYHSGEVLAAGRKYALRTDVMFTRPEDQAREDEMQMDTEDVWADVEHVKG